METIKNILVTGGGAPGAPGILKAILESNTDITLFSCDIQEHTAGKLLAHHYFTVPVGDSPEYIDSLLRKCIEHQIELVLPITTRELIPLAQNKALFAKNNIKEQSNKNSSFLMSSLNINYLSDIDNFETELGKFIIIL